MLILAPSRRARPEKLSSEVMHCGSRPVRTSSSSRRMHAAAFAASIRLATGRESTGICRLPGTSYSGANRWRQVSCREVSNLGQRLERQEKPGVSQVQVGVDDHGARWRELLRPGRRVPSGLEQEKRQLGPILALWQLVDEFLDRGQPRLDRRPGSGGQCAAQRLTNDFRGDARCLAFFVLRQQKRVLESGLPEDVAGQTVEHQSRSRRQATPERNRP